MAIVTFDIEHFREVYPEFASMTDAMLQAGFDTACLILDNTDHSVVPYDPPTVTARATLLDMLTCHLLALRKRGLFAVGQVSSASEGSIGTGFAMPPAVNQAGYFSQTQCGLAFWQVMRKYMVGGRYYAPTFCRPILRRG